MFIELEPIFNNIGASVPFDYEMDMSDEEFWAGKPFQKAVRVKGEAGHTPPARGLQAAAEGALSASWLRRRLRCLRTATAALHR